MSNPVERLTTALSDRYTIERELGAGGMATVYLAQDVRHDRKVALKVLRPELASILGGERFLSEIKTTANLQHPHILSLFDSGEADGLVFYVMPYVDGESLRDRLTREKQLPVEDAVRIAREVADALEYAHGHGVVHRDIKPENILLHGGHSMVADFGIALAASRSDGGKRMTETGMSLGTPHYMAPEQAMGEREITAKADIYALGCVLYEMLTGEPPFTGPTAQAIIARVMTEEPRSLTLQRKTVPPHVEAAIRTALQKLPADRFTTAARFAEALARPGLAAAPEPAGPAGQLASRRRGIPRLLPLLPWLGWVLAALAILAAVWGRTGNRSRDQVLRFAVGVPADQALRTDHDGTSLALSPDGRTLVYVGRGSRGRQLFIRHVAQLEPRPIPGTEGAESPFFSPDGQWVAFFSGGKLRKVALAGGPPLAIADVSSQRGGSWGTDDHIVFVSSSTGPLLKVAAAGGPVDTLTALRSDSGDISHRWPVILPGNQAVVYAMQGSEGYSLAAVSLRDRRTVSLVRGASQAAYVSTGHLVYATQEGSLVAAPFDPRKLLVTGSPVSLLEGLLVKPSAAAEFTVSPAGTLAYLGGQSSGRSLVLVSRTGTERLIGRELLGLAAPRFSPDGRRIALEVLEQRSAAIRVLDIGRGTMSRLTFEGLARYPEWTADGRRIGFAWSKTGTQAYDLFEVAADGSREPQLLLAAPNAQWELSFSPRAPLAVYRESHPATRRDLWVLPLDSPRVPRPYLRSVFEERTPAVSPDGRWVAYTSDESSADEVYVRAFPEPTGRWQISVNGGTEPRWSRDGRTIFYRTTDSLVAVEVRSGPTLDVGQRRFLFAASYQRSSNHADYDVSPDGSQFVFVKSGPDAANLVVVINWFDELRRRMAGGSQEAAP